MVLYILENIQYIFKLNAEKNVLSIKNHQIMNCKYTDQYFKKTEPNHIEVKIERQENDTLNKC